MLVGMGNCEKLTFSTMLQSLSCSCDDLYYSGFGS